MSEADQGELDRRALEDLVVNNADLERLEALLDRFNIFEAVGLVWQEIRHSTFLAFLLNPQESHSLSDAFAKRVLQEAVRSSPGASAPVTPIELSLWDLGEVEVWREWRRIDIFLLDEQEKLAVIIENKIGAGEHGDQLNRYYEAVRDQYPDYRLLALYLTPDGDEPSHPEYLPVNYQTVCEILDELAESRASVIEPDAKVLMKHYTEMLRRHIVGDSEIARLSQQIYQKHSRAIDLIAKTLSENRQIEQDVGAGKLNKRQPVSCLLRPASAQAASLEEPRNRPLHHPSPRRMNLARRALLSRVLAPFRSGIDLDVSDVAHRSGELPQVL